VREALRLLPAIRSGDRGSLRVLPVRERARLEGKVTVRGVARPRLDVGAGARCGGSDRRRDHVQIGLPPLSVVHG